MAKIHENAREIECQDFNVFVIPPLLIRCLSYRYNTNTAISFQTIIKNKSREKDDPHM